MRSFASLNLLLCPIIVFIFNCFLAHGFDTNIHAHLSVSPIANYDTSNPNNSLPFKDDIKYLANSFVPGQWEYVEPTDPQVEKPNNIQGIQIEKPSFVTSNGVYAGRVTMKYSIVWMLDKSMKYYKVTENLAGQGFYYLFGKTKGKYWLKLQPTSDGLPDNAPMTVSDVEMLYLLPQTIGSPVYLTNLNGEKNIVSDQLPTLIKR